jgi:2-hydroxychromene-2-carboxylate isomerase
MTSNNLEFWFDFSCPYAYLASTQVEALADRTGATLDVRPAVLGGIFKARDVPQRLFETLSPAKARHNADDLRRHAARWNVALSFPENHPLKTITALRSLLVVGEPHMPLVHKFYEAYWVKNLNIGDDDVVVQILNEAGHDGAAIVAQTKEQSIKDELFKRTDEAITKGIFGVPAFFVDGAMFWGQDRMDLVEEALTGVRVSPTGVENYAPGTKVDFYFDYSSPFSYLGASRARKILGPDINWKPMLLGGLFKSIGTENVPLFKASEAKRKYLLTDCYRGALQAEVPFIWPSRFPMNTVLPLRVTLLAGAGNTPESEALIHKFYQAYWGHDLDIMNADVIIDLCNEAGLDGLSLVEGSSAPEIKEKLKRNTIDAVEAGVFGAPTTIVHRADGVNAVFWGNDRIELAAEAAAGANELF